MHEIVIIGCGVMGLTSALAIQEKMKDVKLTIFTINTTPNTTSDIAAGLWEPYLLQNTPQEKVFQWSVATYEYLLKLWKEGKASEAGICLQPVTYAVEDQNYKRPDWLEPTLGYTELTEKQLEALGKRYGIILKGGFVFNTFTWEGSTLLPYLQKEYIRNGGNIVIKKIFNLQELCDYDVVVNCTGLGAKELLGDTLMNPIRGQIMKVSAPWIFHSYIIDSEKSGYILANKNFTVLGGTRQLDPNREFYEVDAENIIINCSKLLPSIKSAKLIKHQVGLRPGRESVRLEIEIQKSGQKQMAIVHNYGHGGAGITLSVGCAKEVAGLVEDILKTTVRHKL